MTMMCETCIGGQPFNKQRWDPKQTPSPVAITTAINNRTATTVVNDDENEENHGGGNFLKNKSRRCDRFHQIFVQIGAILSNFLAIFRPFENYRAFWNGRNI